MNVLGRLSRKRKTLRWAEHTIINRNFLLWAAIEQNLVRKRPLERPKIKWENTFKKDVEALEDKSNLNILALDRNDWGIGHETGWFPMTD